MSDEQTAEPRRSQTSFLVWLMLIPLVGTMCVGVWLVTRPGPDGQGESFNAFNLSEVPKDERPRVPTGGPLSAPMPERPPEAAAPGGPGLSGFVPESDPLFTAPKGAAKGSSMSSLSEKEFLKKHDAAIRDYQRRVLGPLADKYYKNYPIVREVDAAFGRLNRYMALCAQYQKDRDLYKWARSVSALPEVRQTVIKYALRPEVWRVAVGMSTEALKNPPPKPIHDELTRFISSDKQIGSAMSEVTQQIMPNMGTLMTKGIPPGVDIGPLTKVTGALTSNAVPQTQTSPAPPRGGTGRR